MKNYQHSFKKMSEIKNWDEATLLVDEVLGLAGLTDEQTLQAQRDAGRRAAESLNAKQTGKSFEGSVPGRKV